MSAPSQRGSARDAFLEFFGSPRFTAALTAATIGTAFGSFLLEHLIGWGGLLGIVGGLVALCSMSLIARRGTLEWRGLLPISLLIFLGWSAISLIWSQYQWSTLGGVAYQAAFALLGVFIALTRDVIQIVRSFGDVLRVVLGLSLAVEIVAGLLLDSPIRFIGVTGNLADGGPIQGIEGTRNQLGLVALFALVSFGTELLTRSVSRTIAIVSLVGAALTIVFTRSPVNLAVLGVLGLASLALLGLRRMKPETRSVAQWVLLAVTAVAAIVAYVLRARLLGILNANNELEYRLTTWRKVLDIIRLHTLEGWGWVGTWRDEILPFSAIKPLHASALNAYIDVWFQLGLVGLFAFLTLAALAFVRSWLLAARQRSRAFVWPALILVALLATSLAESSLLVDAGWLTLVICTVKAAHSLSWRRSLPDRIEDDRIEDEPG
jgi:O-antigen ligase